jgi:hypothetical protein
MSTEAALLRGLSFGLALVISVPALADRAAPVEIIGSVGVDGSGATGEQNIPEVMFGGKTPPHGFQICIFPDTGPCCSIAFNDSPNPSLPRDANGSPGGYYQLTAPIIQNTPNRGECYTTPPGYRPPGPVYILSPDNTGVRFFARMW